MLKRFLKSYLIIKIIFSIYLYADCIEYNKNYLGEECQYLKIDKFIEIPLYLEISKKKGKFDNLNIYYNGKLIIVNNDLLAKSMKHDDSSAKALKNIFFNNKQLVISLGTLRGNNYIENNLYFEYSNNKFLLNKFTTLIEDFYEDKKSFFEYKVIENLSLSELNYDDFLIKDKILEYVKKILILSQKTQLYKTPSEDSITKMYLIAGDKADLLEEKTDEKGVKWYNILYHGKKKNINAWIKADNTVNLETKNK